MLSTLLHISAFYYCKASRYVPTRVVAIEKKLISVAMQRTGSNINICVFFLYVLNVKYHINYMTRSKCFTCSLKQ